MKYIALTLMVMFVLEVSLAEEPRLVFDIIEKHSSAKPAPFPNDHICWSRELLALCSPLEWYLYRTLLMVREEEGMAVVEFLRSLQSGFVRRTLTQIPGCREHSLFDFLRALRERSLFI